MHGIQRIFNEKEDAQRCMRGYQALEPDEIFLDSKNLPAFDRARLEGSIERPIANKTFFGFLASAAVLGTLVIAQSVYLMLVEHEYFSSWAEQNRLQHSTIIAERGSIVDRRGEPLAENKTATTTSTFAERVYPLGTAAAQLVGYISYPKRDANGYWYQEHTTGIVGAEAYFDDRLKGENGIEITETDARGTIVSGSVVRTPKQGDAVSLSIDSGLQLALFSAIQERVDASFIGGAGAIMDISNGEILALVSSPSFDPIVMSSGIPAATVREYAEDPRAPFVDRAAIGLYTPGSIVKPFVAAAALEEGVARPETTYVSTGKLVIPNPYDPSKPTIFRDWKAHGAVDLRDAIAVSSDVYFYIIGGGFESARGIGITALDRYARLFGFGSPTGFVLDDEPSGTIPNPEWKADEFDGDIWRVGDTYNTAIGQYGWQVTALQALQATAALANGGVVRQPIIELGAVGSARIIPISESHLSVVRQGMRQAVTGGTAQALSFPELHVAAKTGTAETGVRKEYTNSLVIGFFPYEEPRYAFVIVLERSKAGTVVGAPAAMRTVFEWIIKHRPEMYSTGLTEEEGQL